MKKYVLFVCVENSCRSQMAEGFARAHAPKNLEIWSAGSKPSGKINETAVQVMKERGIDLGLQRSKNLSDLPSIRWNYLVTMGCGDACPHLPADQRLDWELPDPKNLPIEQFRKIRDDIETRVKKLIHDAEQ